MILISLIIIDYAINPANYLNRKVNIFWVALSIVELIVILILLSHSKNRKVQLRQDTSRELLNNSRTTKINMDNLMNDISKSRDLYKKLSTVCHPDRFSDPEMHKKANNIFQELSRNKRNYNRLIEIKEVAEQQLKIKIPI